MITKQKGTMDIYGEESQKRMYVNDILRSICEKYNYSYIETPVFEASELFHRAVGDATDIVSKETYDFVDRGNRNLTLRPEGTAGVCRWYIENKLYGNQTEPVKAYYIGKMYRYDRPQLGRYRELTQFGIELIGSDDVLADLDVISLAYNTYTILGLKDVTININTLGDKESRNNYRKALIEYLIPYKEELCEDCKERIEKNPLRVLDCKIDGEKDILLNAPKTTNYLNETSLNRYNKLKEYLELLDINYKENPRLVRGLDYYDHTVFEITADVPEMGNLALGGGGRYNGLIELLDGPSVPAVGFAMGYDRTVMAMTYTGVNFDTKDGIDIYIMYVSDTEKETAALLAQDLRLNDFITETDYLNKGLKGEFKSADRLKAKYLIIINDQDLENNEVNVKDNLTKEEEKVNINNLVEYLDSHR
ncbi:MAG: histidine--tRNA ligase [Mollicutes bacterium]|nr:histidine--tRNA ligase [Mollicutes bacterium]